MLLVGHGMTLTGRCSAGTPLVRQDACNEAIPQLSDQADVEAAQAAKKLIQGTEWLLSTTPSPPAACQVTRDSVGTDPTRCQSCLPEGLYKLFTADRGRFSAGVFSSNGRDGGFDEAVGRTSASEGEPVEEAQTTSGNAAPNR